MAKAEQEAHCHVPESVHEPEYYDGVSSLEKVVVHLSDENVELLEKVRQHYNSFRVPGQKHVLFAEDELDMLLVHILKEHAETLGLYSWP